MAENSSPISGTSTAMLKVRLVCRYRAKRLGRYLYFRTASQMRSFVGFAMVLDRGEFVSTTETVVGERPRCSAKNFSVTRFGPELWTVFGRGGIGSTANHYDTI